MTSGYNLAMAKSPSKYKVYLHQDVFIIDPDFITRIATIFQSSPRLGLLGVIGAKSLPANGVWWESSDTIGRVLEFRPPTYNYLNFGSDNTPYSPVVALDGLVLITQFDIRWDENIQGFHFYDISQSLRFLDNDLGVGVINSFDGPLVLHSCGNDFNAEEYYTQQQHFLRLYGPRIPPIE